MLEFIFFILFFVIVAKNRLFGNNECLIMGNYSIDVSYFDRLIKNLPFEKHGLTESDLINRDKMSARFAHKISSEKVEKAFESLSKEETIGMRLYLKIMRWQYEAFWNLNLTPIERLHKMSFVTFVVRIWRKYVCSKKNFLSYNTYTCIDINFHNLICVMMRMREESLDNYFFPFMMHSQHCESFFRCVRSFSGNQSTRINFSVFELFQRMRHIVCSQRNQTTLSRLGLKFSRSNKYEKLTDIRYTLPSNAEIFSCIKDAQVAVFNELLPVFENLTEADFFLDRSIRRSMSPKVNIFHNYYN